MQKYSRELERQLGAEQEEIGRIDYMDGTLTWSRIKDRNRWRAYLAYKAQDGIKEAGKDKNGNPTFEPVYKWKSKSRMLPAEVDTESKAKKAARKWRDELIAEQDKAIERAQAIADAEKEAEKRAQIAAERARKANRPKVLETVSLYVEGVHADGSAGLRTTDDYRSAVKHFECWKDVALEDLTTDQIIEWLRKENKSYAPYTVRKAFSLLRRTYDYECARAREHGQTMNNPCDSPRIKLPPRETKRGRDNSLDEEGVARTAALLRSLEQVPVVTAARIALETGLREAEISALRWMDVDIKNHTLHVQHAISRNNHGSAMAKPKTKKSARKVPIDAELERVFIERRAVMQEEARAVGLTADEFRTLYVIGTVDGRFYDPNRISRAWSVVASVLGIYCAEPDDNGRPVPLTFHGLRHSYASVTLAGGADVEAVAENLGHSSASTTLDVYAAATDTGKRRAAEVMERATAPRPQGEVVRLKTGTDSRG